jgi:hypothetical protein
MHEILLYMVKPSMFEFSERLSEHMEQKFPLEAPGATPIMAA